MSFPTCIKCSLSYSNVIGTTTAKSSGSITVMAVCVSEAALPVGAVGLVGSSVLEESVVLVLEEVGEQVCI